MAALRTTRSGHLLVAGCGVLAALSLLGPAVPTYDPWAWLIWGRQIAEGHLDTIAGPSWKPLPVIFTSAVAAVDADWAPHLWLLVVRWIGLLSLVLAFRAARRLAGTAAGVIAVASLLLSWGYVAGFARGSSEAILVAAWLWAIERHLAGRTRQAFLLGVAAALLRPEVWPFLAAYGLWLLREGWGPRPPWRLLALLGASAVAVLVLWFVPEHVGSGSFLRGADRARETVEGSPATAGFPFLAVFTNSAAALAVPVYAGALLAVAFAVPRRHASARARGVLALAAVASAYMLIVAALAQAGFTGNLRYVTLPAALVCVLAGAGWAGLAAAARRRASPRAAAAVLAGAALASLPFVVITADQRAGQLDRVVEGARDADTLPRAIERSGGTAALLRCGHVVTGPFETQLLAWHLHVPSRRVGIEPRRPGTTMFLRKDDAAPDARFGHVVHEGRWVVRSTCPPAG